MGYRGCLYYTNPHMLSLGLVGPKSQSIRRLGATFDSVSETACRANATNHEPWWHLGGVREILSLKPRTSSRSRRCCSQPFFASHLLRCADKDYPESHLGLRGSSTSSGSVHMKYACFCKPSGPPNSLARTQQPATSPQPGQYATKQSSLRVLSIWCVPDSSTPAYFRLPARSGRCGRYIRCMGVTCMKWSRTACHVEQALQISAVTGRPKWA